jgi:rubrerythrin
VLDELGRLHEPHDDHSLYRTTGDLVQGAFRCAACGYGVALTSALPPCPMCGGHDWEDELLSAFSRARSAL